MKFFLSWLVKAMVALASLSMSTISFADFIAAGTGRDASTGYLYIFGEPGVSGTISSNNTALNQSFTIPATGVLEINTGNLLLTGGFSSNVDSVANRALFVESEDPIGGYFLVYSNDLTDMSYLLDIDSLGTDYRIASFTPRRSSDFSVVATEDNTTITITPTANLTSGQTAGTSFIRTLNAGESLYYSSPDRNSSDDLTGSSVNADKPIAVFSGNRCPFIPVGEYSCDPIYTQLPSTDNYADTFIVPETALTGSVGNVIRIISDVDNTEVSVNGSVVTTLNAGEFYELDPAFSTLIESSNPVLVAQYLKGNQATTNFGDPSLTFIPGVNQLLSDYVFSPPAETVVFDENYLNIAIPTVALASLELNGVAVDTSGFTVLGSSGYSTGNILVSTGIGEIVASEPFVVTMAGYSNYNSYLTQMGTIYSNGVSPIPTVDPVGSKVQSIPASSWFALLLAIIALSYLAKWYTRRFTEI